MSAELTESDTQTLVEELRRRVEGEILSFPLDSRQSTEFLLTSAVSLFAILLIAPRLVGWKVGAALLVLFIAHLLFVDESQRRIFAYVYLGLAGGLVILDRRRLLQAVGIGMH